MHAHPDARLAPTWVRQPKEQGQGEELTMNSMPALKKQVQQAKPHQPEATHPNQAWKSKE